MATITIADNDARVQYTQAVVANTTQLTIDFPFFSLDDINVIVTSAAGVDTTLTRGTGTGTFAVTGTSVDDGYSGGYVTLGDSYTDASTKYTIFRDIDVERTTDFPTSGPFNISSLNTELDKIFAINQELETKIGRTLKLSDSDTSAELSLPNLDTRKGTVLAFNTTTGLPEAGPEIGDVSTIAAITADISTLADIEDGTDATDAIQTVASISSNVTTVAGISSNVSTVAGISSDVSAVASDATDIGIVSTNIASVNTVATNITEVIAVANDLNEAVSEVETVANDLNEAVSEIETVAASISNVDTVGTNIANVNTVAGNNTNINTVAGISSNITTVAGISGNVTTVAGISGDVTAVAADATDIGTVSTNIANVNTVAGISSNVTTVAGNTTNINTVAGVSANVTTVAGVSSDVTTVAGQISPTNNVGTVAGIASDVSTVSGISANVTTVAGNTTNINTVAGISANVTTVAGISSDVTAVAADATDIGTVATNLASTDTIGTVATNISNVNTVAGISANVTTVAGISSDVTAVAADATDIGTVATNIANVNSVGGSISNVNTVATNISSVNDFADKYRIGASDPTTDNDEGDLFYNTTTDTLKVYTGSAWEQGVTAGSGFLPTTGGSMTGDVSFGDNNKAIFGAGSDLQIFHDGFNSVVRDAGTGHLYLQAEDFRLTNNGATATYMKATNSGSVELRHNNNVKFETTSGGIDVTGTVTADGLTVDTNTLHVDATNNLVGVNTTSPNSITGTGIKNIVVGDGSANAGAVLNAGSASFGSYAFALNNALDGRFLYSSANGLQIETGGTQRMRIARSTGDVSLYADNGTTQGFFWDASTQRLGLGTTAPASNLHVKGNNAEIRLEDSAVANATWRLLGSTGGTTKLFRIFDSTNSADRLAIDGSGNVNIYGTDNRPLAITSFNTVSAGAGWDLDATSGNGVVSVSTGGNERMRIDSSGNVGIGDSVVQATLHVKSAGTAGLDVSQGVKIEGYGAGGNGDAACLAFAAGDAQVKGAITFTRNNSYGRGYMSFLVNNDASFTNPSASDEKMRIDGSGNVGIGTASPSARLHLKTPAGDNCDLFIEDSTFSPNIRMYSGGTNINSSIFYGSGAGTTALQFRQITAGAGITGANTERMRIDTDGNLLVGKTSAVNTNNGAWLNPAGTSWFTATSDYPLGLNRLSSDGTIAQFRKAGTTVGSISVTGSGTTYNTTSDIRLKTEIAPISDATDKLMAMNAVTHKWKADPDADAVVGFIAQEMAEIVPEAVSKGESEDDMWSMDYGRITPVLVAALQDAHKKIEQLEQRIAEMEAK